MKKSTTRTIALTFILTLMMLLCLVQTASAAESSFPLTTVTGDLVADANTLYITEIGQDPVSKMITATVKIFNGSSDKPLVIGGVGFQLSFSDKIAPYSYDPTVLSDPHPYDATRMYIGGPLEKLYDAGGYKLCYAPTPNFQTIGSSVVQNDANGRYIGGKISAVNTNDTISIAPGASATIVQLYFMPLSSSVNNILAADMFSFKYTTYTAKMIVLSTWAANGTRYLVSNRSFPSSSYTYVVSPPSFKMHFLQTAPAVTANNTDRLISGYNAATMEWSYSENSGYQKTAPVVLDDGCTIYVRMAETAYSGSDAEYGNYQKFLASPATTVVFDPDFFSCEQDVSLKKTAANQTSTDGRTHVNDTIKYTVVAKNDGHPLSVWADAVMTDTLPAGLTFAGTVTLNDAALTPGTGYTFSNGTLTVPLGNIPGGQQKTVTFLVTVNSDAYGMQIKNSVKVSGTDGDDGDDLIKETEEDGGGQTVVDRSAKPQIDEITEGDDTVSGSGVNGATITVTFPGGATATATVSGGLWTVDVPAGVNLKAGDKVSAVQSEPTKETSEAAEATVVGRPVTVEYRAKTSANLSRSDGSRHVGDRLQYTITVANNGVAKSLWANVIIEDTLPAEVDFVPDSVKIGGQAVGSPTAVYNATSRTLTVNLGDLAGQTSRVVTFEALINEQAYGKSFKNTALIDGKETTEIDDPPKVIDRSPQPTFDEINEGDKTVSGHGLSGATIEVSFPNSTLKGTATVDASGVWSVTVPNTINLLEGNVVTAVQTVAGLEPSLPAQTTVQAKKSVIPYIHKTSANQTSSDGKTRVGDTILFTITVRNDGPKSLWVGAVVRDPLPAGLTYVTNSVLLDGKEPTFSSYTPANRTLQVTVGNIAYNEQHIITFQATVDADAFGKTILNTAAVLGKDNDGGDDVDEDTEDDGGGFTVTDKSDPPTVDDITRGDEKISGRGKPGAKIIVKLQDGTELTTDVDQDGNWTVDVPPGKEPETGDNVTVVQIETDKDPSDPVVVVVKDKNHRAVHGYVWPLADKDYGLGTDFLNKHAVTVELRPTFKTAAAAGLSVSAVLVANSSNVGLGEFTIENVPFGDYILYISRPGYLVRCLQVTITAATPDLLELAPPGAEDAGIFNIWWGDCNGGNRVDNEDILMIMELMSIGVNANSPLYNPSCDMNADALCDNEDILMVLENWNRFIGMYAGAEDVDFSK